MNVNWKILANKLILWLAIEIFLNCLGLDNMADYSDFLQKRHPLWVSSTIQLCIT
jgi:hypothetical protein